MELTSLERLLMARTLKDREYSFKHCQERAEQRYGTILTRDAWEAMAENCRTGLKGLNNSPAIHTNVNGDITQTTHVLYSDFPESVRTKKLVNGQPIRMKFIVVYEDKRDCVTTLLPPEKDLSFRRKVDR